MNDEQSVAFREGTFEQTSAIELLRELEAECITGRIVFTGEPSGAERSEVQLIHGELADDQPSAVKGYDPVDEFVDTLAGAYWVYRELPSLPVSDGNIRTKNGSLAVHLPVDLMNYCEAAGLVGLCRFDNSPYRCELAYDRGEIVSIQLEGTDELSEVLGWADGTFIITMMDAPPTFTIEGRPTDLAPIPEMDEEDRDTTKFLRVVEVALKDIIDKQAHAKANPPSRKSVAPAAPILSRRSRDDEVTRRLGKKPLSRKKKKRESTIQIVYLSAGEAPEQAIKTAGNEKATKQLETEETQPAKEVASTPNGHAALWVLFCAVLMLLSLSILARVPPLE